MMQQDVTILCNSCHANVCHFSSQEWLGNHLLEAYKFFAIIHIFSSALENRKLLSQNRGTIQYMHDRGLLSIHPIKPSSSSVCPLQPHTRKSCFCRIWRKPTTSSRCSSLTQGCPLCLTTPRSKFRCASVRRTRCIAALPTTTDPPFLCCSRPSCSC